MFAYELQIEAHRAQVALCALRVEAMMTQMQSNAPYEGRWERVALAREKKNALLQPPNVPTARTPPIQRYYGNPEAFDFHAHAAMCRAEVNRLLGRPHDNIPYHPAFER